ncbi:hypothetical protein HK098_005220 [Nowakowskiella sp. JEL0407]|nr:hypothetical protein HK098_005220 [Nowakowskiella sp. JEL0407]
MKSTKNSEFKQTFDAHNFSLRNLGDQSLLSSINNPSRIQESPDLSFHKTNLSSRVNFSIDSDIEKSKFDLDAILNEVGINSGTDREHNLADTTFGVDFTISDGSVKLPSSFDSLPSLRPQKTDKLVGIDSIGSIPNIHAHPNNRNSQIPEYVMENLKEEVTRNVLLALDRQLTANNARNRIEAMEIVKTQIHTINADMQDKIAKIEERIQKLNGNNLVRTSKSETEETTPPPEFNEVIMSLQQRIVNLEEQLSQLSAKVSQNTNSAKKISEFRERLEVVNKDVQKTEIEDLINSKINTLQQNLENAIESNRQTLTTEIDAIVIPVKRMLTNVEALSEESNAMRKFKTEIYMTNSELSRRMNSSRAKIVKLQKKIQKKVDLVVIEELLRHIATREDLINISRNNYRNGSSSPQYSRARKSRRRSLDADVVRKEISPFVEDLRDHLDSNKVEITVMIENLNKEFQTKLDELEHKCLHQKKKPRQHDNTSTDSQNSTQTNLLRMIEKNNSVLSKRLWTEFDEKLYFLSSELCDCKSQIKSFVLPFHKYGQWQWSSGSLNHGSSIPWNDQTFNTDQENLMWEQDKAIIEILEGGLYEIACGVFSKSKISLEISVNDEPVISALNSPSYTVRMGGFKEIPLKVNRNYLLKPDGEESETKIFTTHVSGISLIDFFMIPAESKIGIHCHGLKKDMSKKADNMIPRNSMKAIFSTIPRRIDFLIPILFNSKSHFHSSCRPYLIVSRKSHKHNHLTQRQFTKSTQLKKELSEESLNSSANKNGIEYGHNIFEFFEKKTPRLPRHFRFSHGASALSKKGELPVDDGKYFSVQVGEDAYFAESDSLGVADGVGGWNQYRGANPALYSRKLMHYINSRIAKLSDYSSIDYSTDSTDSNLNLRKILKVSCQEVASDHRLVGSTTILFAVLRDEDIHIANLGDCGLMLIRGGREIVFRTEEQQHSFNFPYQLGTGSSDSPLDAQVYKVKVKHGDIVVLGTDGFFDNVFDDEVLDIVRKVSPNFGESDNISMDLPQRISDALLKRAREVAEDTRAPTSPFQARAIEEGLYYQGGKLDDITVVVGVIVSDEDSPDRR